MPDGRTAPCRSGAVPVAQRRLAALGGRRPVVERLVELDADLDAESQQEFTPLDGAREGGFPEIGQHLRAHGAIRPRGTRDGGTRPLIEQGIEALDNEHFFAAIEAFEKALHPNPRSARAHLLLADATRQRGDAEGPLACYDRAIDIDAGLLAAWGGKGNALMVLERYDEAVACLEEVLRQSPADDKACFNIAMTRNMQGLDAEAILRAKATLERKPGHAAAGRRS